MPHCVLRILCWMVWLLCVVVHHYGFDAQIIMGLEAPLGVPIHPASHVPVQLRLESVSHAQLCLSFGARAIFYT